MSKKDNVLLKNIVDGEENTFFEGRPNKTAYVLNACKDDFPKFVLDVFFKCVLIPLLFIQLVPTLPTNIIVVGVIIWTLYLLPTLAMLKTPFVKAKECKNTYYIVTDKAIYIQFGIDQIYYRKYPNDRIGTRVFYRANKIDNMFGVGTLGFSVDDYYEERITSVADYESLFNVLKDVTNSRKEEQIRRQEERQEQKRKFEEQAKLLAQEKLFLEQQEAEEERKRHERYEREMEEHFRRERERHEEHVRQIEEQKRRERERRRQEQELEDEVEELSNFRNKQQEENFPSDEDATDAYDMYGVETEDRPPSKERVEEYNSRYAKPSLKSHGRNSIKRGKKSIKMEKPDPNAPAQEEKTPSSINMNKLWGGSSDNKDEE